MLHLLSETAGALPDGTGVRRTPASPALEPIAGSWFAVLVADQEALSVPISGPQPAAHANRADDGAVGRKQAALLADSGRNAVTDGDDAHALPPLAEEVEVSFDEDGICWPLPFQAKALAIATLQDDFHSADIRPAAEIALDERERTVVAGLEQAVPAHELAAPAKTGWSGSGVEREFPPLDDGVHWLDAVAAPERAARPLRDGSTHHLMVGSGAAQAGVSVAATANTLSGPQPVSLAPEGVGEGARPGPSRGDGATNTDDAPAPDDMAASRIAPAMVKPAAHTGSDPASGGRIDHDVPRLQPAAASLPEAGPVPEAIASDGKQAAEERPSAQSAAVTEATAPPGRPVGRLPAFDPAAAALPRLAEPPVPAAVPARPALIDRPVFVVPPPPPGPLAEAPPFPTPGPASMRELPFTVVKAVADGRTEMTVALRPPELGQLTIRLQFADGQLQVEVRADRPETLLLLQREADGFERSLRQAGLELRDGGLQLAAQGDGGRQRPGGGPAWHGVARDEAAQDGAGETATGGAAAGEGPLPHVRAPYLAANGRLDLRI